MQNNSAIPQPSANTYIVADYTSPAPPIAWQSIRRQDNSLVAHEIFNRSRTASTHTMDSDLALAHAVLSHIEPANLLDNGLLFINTTYESLAGPHLNLLHAPQVVLEIPSLGHAASTEVATRRPALAALRAKGFALAFNHSVLDSAYEPWHDLVDYLKIDMSVLSAERTVLMIQWARRLPHAIVIADKIETPAQLQLAKESHVDLLQGYAVSRPEPVPARVVRPSAREVNALQQLLKSDPEPDIDTLTDCLRTHPALLFNLLRMARARHMYAQAPYTSIAQLLSNQSLAQMRAWATMLQAVALDTPHPPEYGVAYAAHSAQLWQQAQQLWPHSEPDVLSLITHALLLGHVLGLDLEQSAMQLLPPPLGLQALSEYGAWQKLLPVIQPA